MPYINPNIRKILENDCLLPINAGEINFIITQVLDRYLCAVGLSYANLNSCIGALECAKLELYRRIAAPYEDKRLAENGDVYECQK